MNGVGAANNFDGNGKVGSGRAEIVMSGHQPFIGKLMGVFINTEKMVGGAFESGLAEAPVGLAPMPPERQPQSLNLAQP